MISPDCDPVVALWPLDTQVIAQPLAAPRESRGQQAAPEVPFELIADKVEVEFDSQTLHAQGNVEARYGDYLLGAQKVVYDMKFGQLRAFGSILARFRDTQFETDNLDFDLPNEQTKAGRWSGNVGGRGRFSGDFLFLSPSYAFANGVIYSPCQAQDPGYFLSSDRLEWFPFEGKRHFEGNNVSVHVSGARLARIPSFRAAIGDEDPPDPKRRTGGRAIDSQVGFNAYDGAFAAGTGIFNLADSHFGTFPIRVTQGRGIFVGTTQAVNLGPATIAGDASYQTRYQGGTSGPRANALAQVTLPGGPQLSLGVGYRTAVGGQSLHRLPELGVHYPVLQLGPIGFQAGIRSGYALENYSTEPPSDDNPFSQPHEVARVRGLSLVYTARLTPPPWRPSTFWESAIIAGGNMASYVEGDQNFQRRPGRHQIVGNVVLQNIQNWSEFLNTHVNFEVNRTDGISPFLHDRSFPTDAVSAGATVNWTPRWSTAISTQLSRAPEQPSVWHTELNSRLSYHAPCLSWALSLQVVPRLPFSPAISFEYQFLGN